MKLKYDWKYMEIAGETVAVPTEVGAFNGVIKLNDSAIAIFNLLQDETTEDTIVNKLTKSYSTSPKVLCNYVHEFIQKLDAEGLLG